MTNLMIVAHPDDEILFGYSALIRDKWDVLCITNASHPVRGIEIKEVCARMGVNKLLLWDYKDEWGGEFDYSLLCPQLNEVLASGYNNVYTHSASGDYGHSQHASLFTAVNRCVAHNLFCFSYNSIPLPLRILKDKIEMLSMYKSQWDLNAFDWYDNKNCNNRMLNWVISEYYVPIR